MEKKRAELNCALKIPRYGSCHGIVQNSIYNQNTAKSSASGKTNKIQSVRLGTFSFINT